MSMHRVFSCVVGRGCLLWPVFSWENSISLCPASFYTQKPNFPVTPCISRLPTFAFHSSIMKRTSFSGIILEGTVDLIEQFNFSFFSSTGWGTDLHYCDIEWFALENNRDLSVIFEIASKFCIRLFCWLWGLLLFFWRIIAHSSRYNGHLS